LPPHKEWLVPVFLVLATILLLPHKEWDAPLLVDQVRALLLVAPSIAKAGLGLPSRAAPVRLVVDLEVLVSVAPAAAPPVAVLELARVAVVPVLVDVVADRVVEPQVRLVVAVERANLASQSGQSVKSSKCGRPRA